jgi:hypothetical protein
MQNEELPDWENVLSSAARLQQIVPGAFFAKHLGIRMKIRNVGGHS